MARILTQTTVLKELADVADRLATSVVGEQRLALLRRQADLGDLRDALAARARGKVA